MSTTTNKPPVGTRFKWTANSGVMYTGVVQPWPEGQPPSDLSVWVKLDATPENGVLRGVGGTILISELVWELEDENNL